jgi:hypothetical protein
MSGTTTTETVINDAAKIGVTALEVAFPEITTFLSLAQKGLPVAEGLYNAAMAQFENVKATVTITPAQIAADDAALDAADATLQAATPAAS